ncbi:glycosyltransferase family 2 protein [Myriangium duriaei CBS 260.36]|uniref:chitin synthase n=1 Tax=Myriangium duriaei CBS 260.36 TaxID=1168546 RepID=A0A9P4J4D4_9PEZI|nr:glycosyltransferase family 2 protein [Myriangium duriaei CBS 260.36]
MAGHQSRMSTYSNQSNLRPSNQPSAQLSTTTLLNALHTSFAQGQPYPLESSTSVAVNTWVTALNAGPDGRIGGTVDLELARRAWEHARRRAEDGCIILGSLHEATPSLLAPFASAVPVSVPGTFYTALNALRPFFTCVTPRNASLPRYSALSATFTLALTGDLTGASLALSTGGIDTKSGLTNVPSQTGYRAFDVFYYLLKGAAPTERELLELRDPSTYALLKKTETYDPPAFLPTADDAAAAEDFRDSLRLIGIKGASLRNLLTVLAAILRLGDALGYLIEEDELTAECEEIGGLLDLDPDVLIKRCDTTDREMLIGAIYEALVDWVISKANEAIRSEIRNGRFVGSSSSSDEGRPGANTPPESEEGDSVSITLVEIPSSSLCRAVAMRAVFDDTTGINAEMKEDGVPVIPPGSSVTREMNAAVAENEFELGIFGGASSKDREVELDKREGVLEKVGSELDSESFLRRLLYPIDGQGILLGKTGRFSLPNLLSSSRVWFHLSLHPTDDSPASLANQAPGSVPWSAGSVSSQIRTWRLPEWANHRNKHLDYSADFDHNEFAERYAPLGCQPGRDGVESWIMQRGWSNGEVVVGSERIWIREGAWWEAESMLDIKPLEDNSGILGGMDHTYGGQTPQVEDGFFQSPFADQNGSSANLLDRSQSMAGRSQLGARSLAPTQARTMISTGDYGLGTKGDDKRNAITYYGETDPEYNDPMKIQEVPITFGRRVWVAFTWLMTWWIPSFVLRYAGRMKRPDVRMAWREKLVLIMIIVLINATVVFYIIEFGKLLCPNYDKAWNTKEVGYHQGQDDWYVSHMGSVYDLSKFWRTQHSDTSVQTTSDQMEPFAGTDVTEYILPPLWRACQGLVTSSSIVMQPNTTLTNSVANHLSGNQTAYQSSKLASWYWYEQTFLPKMQTMRKGDLVFTAKEVKAQGQGSPQHMWVIINNKIFDLTDYFHTKDVLQNMAGYNFFGSDIENLFQSNAGLDVTDQWATITNSTFRTNAMACMENAFYAGRTDFRVLPKCQVNNYILLAFTCIIGAVILIKFLAALQLGSKRRPAMQDKFVICQVPAYTEGEDHLRKGLDSLTALAYDNKRKLICVICDGMIVGGGNDRPTPKIVLDVLGVDPKIDPPALPFKSVGQGAEQLNYGKVYSGLYEYEGNVVPYLVVVKVGKESEQSKSKPGNRGKRDSQILLMSFLNRVHHRSPMSPLELEMFHQINNIIGVDPELYEYLLMVDADTMVKEDSLNRLVASCANDAKIAGICGETSLENEERSWWTMIQVYEYYISHHLAKAFESLFGSVTCLPGCFCMYRLRTADKGKPLIISDQIIREYSDCNIDTLHKKNLLSLGEDRYLTTLMTKHFPHMSYKFIPDAYALTAAPETWSVLLSQRRRWINSTIHNLAELVFLKDLCGFCCFSMRFVVFIDLFGTIILPATCVYLGWLIYRVATHSGQFPLISIIMLAAVYGLQALIFIIKRQWQHIGWMIIYILAFPIYSFVLPIYSFWKQDDFSWGNTRVVIGEKGNKKVVAEDDEGFDPRSIPLQRWDQYALANNLPGRRGAPPQEKEQMGYHDGYEMDDMHSTYSSIKPASTVLTGMPGANMHFRPPQSPGPYNALSRGSTYSHLPGQGQGYPAEQTRLMSMGGMSDHYTTPPQFSRNNSQNFQSMPDLNTNLISPTGSQMPGGINRARSPLGNYPSQGNLSRPASHMSLGLQGFQTQGPSDGEIANAIQQCLREVDLDTVTKKQLKALTEQRLQCQLSPEKRAFLDAQIDQELANM